MGAIPNKIHGLDDSYLMLMIFFSLGLFHWLSFVTFVKFFRGVVLGKENWKQIDFI